MAHFNEKGNKIFKYNPKIDSEWSVFYSLMTKKLVILPGDRTLLTVIANIANNKYKTCFYYKIHLY